jgi:hypothetical protein
MSCYSYRWLSGQPGPARHGPMPGMPRWGSGRHDTSCLPGHAELGFMRYQRPRHALSGCFGGRAGPRSMAYPMCCAHQGTRGSAAVGGSRGRGRSSVMESEREPPRGASRRGLHAIAQAGARRGAAAALCSHALASGSLDPHSQRHSMPDLHGRRPDGDWSGAVKEGVHGERWEGERALGARA